MQYEELNLHEHTLKRPDTYVGSTHVQTSEEYLVVEQKFIKKEIEYIPAVLRIFVEAVSNAIDNVYRSKQYDMPCKSIKITIEKDTGRISVWNDGLTIPIQTHEKTNIYIPEMLFGRLLTSSNYNDEEKRETSGRNGLGISLTNIFSSEFSVDLVDNGKHYTQSWKNNMRERTKAKITSAKNKKGYTCVSWIADFDYFRIQGYTDDFIALLYKYVYDTAMIVSKHNVSVVLNGEKCPIKSFKDYSKMYTSVETKEILSFQQEQAQCICMSSTNGYEEISFVNGVYTKHGGVHVDSWSEPILKAILQKLQTKFKNLKLSVRDIKPYFKFVIECSVVNPTFSTQSKDKLVSPRIPVKVETKDVQSVLQWSFIQDIQDTMDMKDKLTLKKSESKRMKRIDGFDPANKAGGKDSSKCTLILCEGLSAKTYAVMGIDQGTLWNGQTLKGRDWFGIMPLRGVVMNVRNATSSAILANKEIVNIIQALGVQYDTDYSKDEHFKKLRYGRIMILTDADCFPKSTSVFIRRHQRIQITTMKELYESIHSQPDTEVLDGSGWTRVKGIVCKQSEKPIYTISTKHGIFRCTSDHPCVLHDGTTKIASELSIGDTLLQATYPPIEEQVECIDTELAWLLGVIFMTGRYRQYKLSMVVHTRIVQSVSRLFHQYFGNTLRFSENESNYTHSYAFTVCTQELIKEMFIGKYKHIPRVVMEGTHDIRKAFLNGCSETQNTTKYQLYGEVTAQHFMYLMHLLGQPTEVHLHSFNTEVYVVSLVKHATQDHSIRSIAIQYTKEEVYDIETESHHVSVGVGRTVVHNCDGIHIQALILNMFHHLFPTLFHRKGFITSMSTPIMKVQYKQETLRFYDLTTAKRFLETHSGKHVQIKYYKGLGTSTDKDVKETFGQRIIEYHADHDILSTMNLAFNKTYATQRKDWLTRYEEKELVLEKDNLLKVSDFIDTELIKFSLSDCVRSIPHLMDGFKESQRKIIYACIKRNLTTQTIKVAQLAGYVAENTNYHHGEGCLFDTITKMAQDFVGSNNLPLLYKDGQFGTRMQPNGSDAANARYIFTKLSSYTRSVLCPEDDPILTYLYDDGDKIEPKYYAPILPMVLVNGANGIATGWSTNIPCFNPTDLIEWIHCYLTEKDEYPELMPYYKGFRGNIIKESDTKYISHGCMERKGDQIIITELPVGIWIDKYKEYLEELVENKKLKSMKNYCKPDQVHFVLTCFKDEPITDATLKLTNSISLSNMVLFDEHQHIRKYERVEDILHSFCNTRLTLYEARKTHQLEQLKDEYQLISNKILFLEHVMNDEIILFKKTDAQIAEQCSAHNIDAMDGSYDYLLNLPLKTFTKEKLQQFKEKQTGLKTHINTLKKSSTKQLWKRDLDMLSSKIQ